LVFQIAFIGNSHIAVDRVSITVLSDDLSIILMDPFSSFFATLVPRTWFDTKLDSFAIIRSVISEFKRGKCNCCHPLANVTLVIE
jgi:hypothetical protein